MTRHILELSPETLAQLDLVAQAPAIDSDLLDAIGMTPAEALRFAEATGNIPSPRDVRCLIRAMGRTPELGRLLALARQQESAESQRSRLASLFKTLTVAGAVAGTVVTVLNRMRARRGADRAAGAGEASAAFDHEVPAVEGESSLEA